MVLYFKSIAELIYNEVMSYENQGQNQGKQPAQPMQNHSGKFSILYKTSHKHVQKYLFSTYWHMNIYILVVGAMKCRYIFFYAFNYRLDVVYNVFVFKYCTIWLNEKYFSSEMSMDLQKSGIDYKPMECLTFNLVPEAKCWENKPAFLPLLVSLKKKVPNCHTSCFFFNFLFKKKILQMVLAHVL